MGEKLGDDEFKGRTWWFRLQNLLVDSLTGLPTLTGRRSEVREALEVYGRLGVLYVNIPRGPDFENLYGWSFYDDFLKTVSELLLQFKKRHLKRHDFVLIRETETSEFVIFVSPETKGDVDLSFDETEILRQKLLRFIASSSFVTHGPIKIGSALHIGCSYAKHVLTERPERSIHYAIEDAKRRTYEEIETETSRAKERLEKVIRSEQVNVRYQAIVRMRDKKPFGFEALSYAEGIPGLDDAEILFNLAEEIDLSVELNRLCREKALAGIQGRLSDLKIFLNTDPRSVEDLGREPEQFTRSLRTMGTDPDSVVLEITERSAIKKLPDFKSILDRFREAGLHIAIDDAGAGYASLNTIAYLKPEFLKFDIALVRGIDKDRMKQELLVTLQNLARKVNARIIAEGIETEKEFKTLLEMGVELGQGYFIAAPKPASEIPIGPGGGST